MPGPENNELPDTCRLFLANVHECLLFTKLAYLAAEELHDQTGATVVQRHIEPWEWWRSKREDGWSLEWSIENGAGGYNGHVFAHHKRRQVVVASRGTKVDNKGALWADVSGVFFNRRTVQIRAIEAVLEEVRSRFSSLERIQTTTSDIVSLFHSPDVEASSQELGDPWVLTFTGHSLGAWLSDVGVFLAAQCGIFSRSITYECPGSRDVMERMQARSKGRLAVDISALPILNFFSSPNVVNLYNRHVGEMQTCVSDKFLEEYVADDSSVRADDWLGATGKLHSLTNFMITRENDEQNPHSSEEPVSLTSRRFHVPRWPNIFLPATFNAYRDQIRLLIMAEATHTTESAAALQAKLIGIQLKSKLSIAPLMHNRLMIRHFRGCTRQFVLLYFSNGSNVEVAAGEETLSECLKPIIVTLSRCTIGTEKEQYGEETFLTLPESYCTQHGKFAPFIFLDRLEWAMRQPSIVDFINIVAKCSMNELEDSVLAVLHSEHRLEGELEAVRSKRKGTIGLSSLSQSFVFEHALERDDALESWVRDVGRDRSKVLNAIEARLQATKCSRGGESDDLWGRVLAEWCHRSSSTLWGVTDAREELIDEILALPEQTSRGALSVCLQTLYNLSECASGSKERPQMTPSVATVGLFHDAADKLFSGGRINNDGAIEYWKTIDRAISEWLQLSIDLIGPAPCEWCLLRVGKPQHARDVCRGLSLVTQHPADLVRCFFETALDGLYAFIRIVGLDGDGASISLIPHGRADQLVLFSVWRGSFLEEGMKHHRLRYLQRLTDSAAPPPEDYENRKKLEAAIAQFRLLQLERCMVLCGDESIATEYKTLVGHLTYGSDARRRIATDLLLETQLDEAAVRLAGCGTSVTWSSLGTSHGVSNLPAVEALFSAVITLLSSLEDQRPCRSVDSEVVQSLHRRRLLSPSHAHLLLTCSTILLQARLAQEAERDAANLDHLVSFIGDEIIPYMLGVLKTCAQLYRSLRGTGVTNNPSAFMQPLTKPSQPFPAVAPVMRELVHEIIGEHQWERARSAIETLRIYAPDSEVGDRPCSTCKIRHLASLELLEQHDAMAADAVQDVVQTIVFHWKLGRSVSAVSCDSVRSAALTRKKIDNVVNVLEEWLQCSEQTRFEHAPDALLEVFTLVCDNDPEDLREWKRRESVVNAVESSIALVAFALSTAQRQDAHRLYMQLAIRIWDSVTHTRLLEAAMRKAEITVNGDTPRISVFLTTLQSIPGRDGARQQRALQQAAWHVTMKTAITSSSAAGDSVYAVLQWIDEDFKKRERPVAKLVQEQLFVFKGDTVHVATKDAVESCTHVVLPIKDENGVVIAFAKFFPEYPGMQHGVNELVTRISGIGMECSMCRLLVRSRERMVAAFPVLLSKAVHGTPLSQQALDKLEPKTCRFSFSLKMLETVLLNPGDDTPSNMVATRCNSCTSEHDSAPAVAIQSVDSEMAFVNATATVKGELLVNSLSTVYLFDIMDEPIDSLAINVILALQPERLLQEWIDGLCRWQSAMFDDDPLFTRNEVHELLESKERPPTCLPLEIKGATVSALLERILKLQDVLRGAEGGYTHSDLLQHMEPAMHGVYARARRIADSNELQRRFLVVPVKNEMRIDTDSGAKEDQATNDDLPQLAPISVSQFVDDGSLDGISEQLRQGTLQQPREARVALDRAIEVFKSWKERQSRALAGDEMAFAFDGEQQCFYVEQLLRHLNWKEIAPEMDQERRSRVIGCMLKHIMSSGLRNLRVVYCKELSDEILETFRHSDRLRTLDLTGCTTLTTDAIVKLLKKEKHLHKINLSYTNIVRVKGTLRSLKSLSVNGCLLLEKVDVDAPVLENLSCNNCGALASIKTKSAALCNLSIRGCGSMTADALEKISAIPLATVHAIDFKGCASEVQEAAKRTEQEEERLVAIELRRRKEEELELKREKEKLHSATKQHTRGLREEYKKDKRLYKETKKKLKEIDSDEDDSDEEGEDRRVAKRGQKKEAKVLKKEAKKRYKDEKKKAKALEKEYKEKRKAKNG